MSKRKQPAAQPPADAAKPSPPQVIRLRRAVEYDTLFPEDTIRQFIRFLRDAQSRYKENMRLVAEYQLQRQDLDHYAEMVDDLNRTEACRYYRKMRDLGRKRRAIKNEAALLEPLMTMLDNDPRFIKQLEQVQGLIGAKKAHIDNLDYTAKTNILNK